jgi:hypothetical protein
MRELARSVRATLKQLCSGMEQPIHAVAVLFQDQKRAVPIARYRRVHAAN